MKKFKRFLPYIFIITIAILLIFLIYQKKSLSLPIQNSFQNGDTSKSWFFLPQFCYENNCLTSDDATNDMSISFPQNIADNEFEEEERCTEENCITVTSAKKLFSFYGITNFEGYYVSEAETAGPGFKEETNQCDKFVIEKGNQTVKNFLQFYARKNSQNTNNYSNLPVNIDLSTLSSDQKGMLLNSNMGNQVKIYVHKPYIASQGIGACYSFVKVLSVKKN